MYSAFLQHMTYSLLPPPPLLKYMLSLYIRHGSKSSLFLLCVKMMQAFGNSYLHAKPIICKPVKRTPHTDQPAVLQYCRHLYSYCLCQTSLCIQAPSHASCMEDKTFYLSSDMVCRTINTVWLCNQVGEPVGPRTKKGEVCFVYAQVFIMLGSLYTLTCLETGAVTVVSGYSHTSRC